MDPIETNIEEAEMKEERINLENLTYYFSKFDIFGPSFNFYFTKYEIFKKNLNGYLGKIFIFIFFLYLSIFFILGEDWNKYAEEILYRLDENNKKVFINNDEIFHFALEIWLELRKEINLNDIDSKASEKPLKTVENFSIESKFEENHVFEIFEKKFREKFIDCLLSTNSLYY